MASSGPTPPDGPPQRSSTQPESPRARSSTVSSIVDATSRLRQASLTMLEADVPHGMWAATATATATAPTIGDIRTGHFGPDGWNEHAQRRSSIGRLSRRGTAGTIGTVERTRSGTDNLFAPVAEETTRAAHGPADEPLDREAVVDKYEEENVAPDTITGPRAQSSVEKMGATDGVDEVDASARPYEPPPKLPWKVSTKIFLRAFWKWFLTLPGFLITIYCLNIVAWGGMLFLLLCNAAPAMCHPDCNNINSPRRIWIEIDSQILNALFCVTGFGLIPWRFRALYFLLLWRLALVPEVKREYGLRRLAGIHRSWFRLQGDEKADLPDADNPAIPLPINKKLGRPLTGERAPPTAGWKLDFVIWNECFNTFIQVVLCVFMWGFNRHDRPSWATGLFIGIGCFTAGIAGVLMHKEGKKIKKIEGVPPKKLDGEPDVEASRDSVRVPIARAIA